MIYYHRENPVSHRRMLLKDKSRSPECCILLLLLLWTVHTARNERCGLYKTFPAMGEFFRTFYLIREGQIRNQIVKEGKGRKVNLFACERLDNSHLNTIDGTLSNQQVNITSSLYNLVSPHYAKFHRPNIYSEFDQK